MKSTKYFTALLFSMFCILLLSCSKDLSRDKATDLIVKKYSLPQAETIKINKEYLVLWEGLYKMRDWEGGCIGYNFPAYLNAFQNSRVIVIGKKNVQGVNGWTGNFQDWLIYTVTLTDEGKKYLVGESALEYELKTCDLCFGEITGIQTQEQFKTAEVNYTLISKNVTPFGLNVSQQPKSRSDRFQLFDDGWRNN